MTYVLDKTKSVNITGNEITVTANVKASDFNKATNAFDPSTYFTEEPVTFYGKAVLKDGDKPNVVEAIHIAEGKMERQYYKYILSHVKREQKILSDYVSFLDNIKDKTENNISSITNHITDIANNI